MLLKGGVTIAMSCYRCARGCQRQQKYPGKKTSWSAKGRWKPFCMLVLFGQVEGCHSTRSARWKDYSKNTTVDWNTNDIRAKQKAKHFI